MNVKAAEIKTGDTLGDGFVVDGVYQAIGNHHALFAIGRAYGVGKPKRLLLGFTGDALVTVR